MEKKKSAPAPFSSTDGFFSLGYRRPPGYGGSAAANAAANAAKTYYYYGEKPVRELV